MNTFDQVAVETQPFHQLQTLSDRPRFVRSSPIEGTHTHTHTHGATLNGGPEPDAQCRRSFGGRPRHFYERLVLDAKQTISTGAARSSRPPASTTSSAANGGRYSTALAADDLCVTLEGARFHGAQLALGQLEPHQLRGRRQVVVAQSLQDVAVEPQVAQLDTHTQTNPSSID